MASRIRDIHCESHIWGQNGTLGFSGDFIKNNIQRVKVKLKLENGGNDPSSRMPGPILPTIIVGVSRY